MFHWYEGRCGSTTFAHLFAQLGVARRFAPEAPEAERIAPHASPPVALEA
jgi:hypothetical protein